MKKTFNSKTILRIVGIIILAVIIGFSMIACGGGGDDDGNGGGGGGGGGLTFSDGLPSGTFTVFVVPNSTSTDMISLTMATVSSFIAYGGYTTASGNRVSLFTMETAWTGSGTYMVVVMPSTSGAVDPKYIKNVSFNGGSATVTKSSLIVNSGL